MKRRLSRRGFLIAGGTGLIGAASAASWQWHRERISRRFALARSGSTVGYADYRGWIVTAGEKQALAPPAAPPIP
jgi:hypothetical protein